MEVIGNNALPKLKSIDLSFNYISTNGFMAFIHFIMANVKPIKKLNFESNYIDSEALQIL